LPPGTRLPPVRRLAGDLGLAPNTIARAYRELERDGYIETGGRHGTYVADGISASLATLDAEIAQLAAHVRLLGVPRRTSSRCSPAPSTSPPPPESMTVQPRLPLHDRAQPSPVGAMTVDGRLLQWTDELRDVGTSQGSGSLPD
jgi:DNA-binding transcriptional MocR family regulator